MRPQGKISFGGLTLLLVIVGGLWALITIAPAYLDNLDMKEAVAAAVNKARQGHGDEPLQNGILQVANRVGTHLEEDEYGALVEKPGLGLTPENVIIERDFTDNTLVIRVEYQRFMQFKPLKQGVTLKFAPQSEGTFPR